MNMWYPDPKHRPVWRPDSQVWACLCGAYQGSDLRFVNAHIDRVAEKTKETS